MPWVAIWRSCKAHHASKTIGRMGGGCLGTTPPTCVQIHQLLMVEECDSPKYEEAFAEFSYALEFFSPVSLPNGERKKPYPIFNICRGPPFRPPPIASDLKISFSVFFCHHLLLILVANVAHAPAYTCSFPATRSQCTSCLISAANVLV